MLPPDTNYFEPSEMASRNWMLRKLLIESIRRDPTYANGEYTRQPPSLRVANVFFALATSGGTLALQKQAPTRALADKLLDQRLAAPFMADANDYLYQWDSSRDYNASPGLERIKAALLAINSADDERNPPETGIMERELKRVPGGQVCCHAGSDALAPEDYHRVRVGASFFPVLLLRVEPPDIVERRLRVQVDALLGGASPRRPVAAIAQAHHCISGTRASPPQISQDCGEVLQPRRQRRGVSCVGSSKHSGHQISTPCQMGSRN